MAHLK